MTGVKKHIETGVGMGVEGSDIRVGIDLSDKHSRWIATDRTTGEIRGGWIQMTPAAVRACFGEMQPSVFVMEAGTHSHWLCLELRALGHRAEVLPADVLRQGSGKQRRRNDSKDAAGLMELAGDVERPRTKTLWQRPDEYQEDLILMRLRDGVVRARAMLATMVRSSVKQFGERIRACDVEYLPKHAREDLSARMLTFVEPSLEQLEQLTRTVAEYDIRVDAYLARRPESERLLSIPGVGKVTVGTIMAVAGDPSRFRNGRDFGAYLGLVPGEDQSGMHDPQLRITKAGDALARKVLVECAQRMIGKLGVDCALKRWALNIAGDGKNKIRKKKAVVALARKLAVLLHHLWVSGERYDVRRGMKTREMKTEVTG
jgi:transposase